MVYVESDSAPTGEWQHIAGVRAAGALKIYIDGGLQADTGSNAGAIDSNGDLFIGNNNVGTRGFNGSATEVAVFDKALSLAEVNDIMNNGLKEATDEGMPPQEYTSQNYTLCSPRIIVSGGGATSDSYSLSKVTIGGIFGGEAQSQSYTLRAGLIAKPSVSIYPLNWLLEGIGPGESRITAGERIIVRNNGNARTSYRLRVIDTAGTWSPSGQAGGNNLNQFILSAIFTDMNTAGISDTHFNESGSEDIVSESYRLSTDTDFATTSSAKNGVGTNPGEGRALYLKFTAPQVDTTQVSEHSIWLIIEAKEVK